MHSVKIAAMKIGISPSKLYALAQQREISHYRVDGKILFSDEDIRAYLASKRVEAGERRSPKPPPAPKPTLKHLSLR